MHLYDLLADISSITFPRGTAFSPLTLKMDSTYDYYSLSKLDADPDDLFSQTASLLTSVRDKMETEDPHDAEQAVYEEYTIATMASMIFGSNFIESSGSTKDISEKVCQSVFAGFTVDPELPSIAPDYRETRDFLREHKRPADQDAIMRARVEIIDHAKAWTYLLSALLKGPLTEEHLLTTHRILCASLPLEDGTPYAGIYRTVPVCAGFTSFAPASSVPGLMRTLVSDYNLAIHRATERGSLDPFTLAAEFAH
ncbi:hypothetical protein V494_06100, partial [Pseudogymnoascus sp. VKM F-4513 (FW-928)]